MGFMEQFRIGNRLIGDGQPAYIIAEMSANHAGSLERAKEIIHAAKESGADCIKIQTYTPDTLTIDCNNHYFHIDNGTWEGENLYCLYGKAYTPWEWQKELKEEAEKVGLDFLSTPFDNTAVDFLEDMGLAFYKIASFEMVDLPLLSYVASKGKPIIMSTGMATLREMKEAVETIFATGNRRLALLKCSSVYPADPADMHLRTISDMKKEFGIPIGLSDHSMGSLSATTAVALGANILEKHFCLSREIENPDASFSMTPEEFKEMVTHVRQTESALGRPMYGPSEQEKNSLVFRRSVFVVQDIKKGETISEENIRIIRPGYGLHPREFNYVLGKTCTKDMDRGMPLTADAVENYLIFREATAGDEKLIFDWANEEETRKQSFHTEPIPWENHREWFAESLRNPDRHLYICYHGETPVGLYRLDREEEGAFEISYSIAQEYRERGYGKAMLSAGEALLREKHPDAVKLTAKVKKGNEASRHLFVALGYEETETEEFYSYSKLME